MADTETDHLLSGHKILLGVSGGIAAYKTAELVRLFKKRGAEVQVLMTPNAARFVTPLTLETLSEREVLTGIFPDHSPDSWTQHVTLGLWANLYVIAPATAQTIAKLANGFCDSMVTAVALAARCPLLICPSMDHDMYRHPSTRRNLDILREYGYQIMDAEFGSLASGLVGEGRMPEPEQIFARVEQLLRSTPRTGVLSGKHVLVSAGPTREAIDPVRFLSNHSTGTMGFALAEAARIRGAQVTLISGPTDLDTPHGVDRIDVTSADDMHAAVKSHAKADIIIMAAAVADYTPLETSASKIKKQEGELIVRLRRTPDILAELGKSKRPGQQLIGFALETDDVIPNARRKLESKNLDWIVLNNLRETGAGFGKKTNRVTLIGRNGTIEELPLMSKEKVAEAILDRIITEKGGH